MLRALGPQELLIIGVVFVLLFGGKKIGQLGKGLGDSIRELRNASREMKEAEKEVKS